MTSNILSLPVKDTINPSSFFLFYIGEIEEKGYQNNDNIVVMVFITKSIKDYFIPDFFAHNCINLTTVVLPEGLEEIESGAFSGCLNLKNINFPTTLWMIHEYVFANCTSLKKVVLSDKISVDPYAFRYSGLETLIIGRNCFIEDCSFVDCRNLKIVMTLPGSIFGEEVFENSNPTCQYIGDFNPSTEDEPFVDPENILPSNKISLEWETNAKKIFSIETLSKVRRMFFSSKEKELILFLILSMNRISNRKDLIPFLPPEICLMIVNCLPILRIYY